MPILSGAWPTERMSVCMALVGTGGEKKIRCVNCGRECDVRRDCAVFLYIACICCVCRLPTCRSRCGPNVHVVVWCGVVAMAIQYRCACKLQQSVIYVDDDSNRKIFFLRCVHFGVCTCSYLYRTVLINKQRCDILTHGCDLYSFRRRSSLFLFFSFVTFEMRLLFANVSPERNVEKCSIENSL